VRLALVLMFLLVRQLCQAEERSYVYKGRTIRYTVTVFKPPLPINLDPRHMNQDSAPNTALLFLARLREGDLEGAAALCTSPEHVIDVYAKYKARVSDQVYAEQMSRVFEDGLHYSFDVVVGAEHALLADKRPGLAHFVRERDGKFFIEFPQPGRGSKEIQDLSVLVNENEAGRLKFE